MSSQQSSSAQTLAAWATAAASLIAFLYVVGGLALWIRFAQADVPPGRAVSVVPQSRLIETALSAVIVPVALVLVVAGAFGRFLASRPPTEDLRQPTKLTARTFGWVIAGVVALLGVLLVPPTAVGVCSYLVLCGFIAFTLHPILHEWEDRTSLPFPWRRFTASLAVFLPIVVLIQEAEKPPRLEPARIDLKDGPTLRGPFIAHTGEAIFVGGRSSIVAVPNERVRAIRIGIAPREARQPDNLLEHILGL